jgi:hypothetical protein
MRDHLFDTRCDVVQRRRMTGTRPARKHLMMLRHHGISAPLVDCIEFHIDTPRTVDIIKS